MWNVSWNIKIMKVASWSLHFRCKNVSRAGVDSCFAPRSALASVFRKSQNHGCRLEAIMRSRMGVVADDSLLHPFWHPCTGWPFWYVFDSSSSSGVRTSGTTLIDVGCSADPPFNAEVLIWWHTVLAVSWPLLLRLFLGCHVARAIAVFVFYLRMR